nr:MULTISPECIES: helix-turn-helix domain-containing protein [Bacillus]
MLVSKAYKFHIYLNKNQEILIAKTIGCNRFVFKT